MGVQDFGQKTVLDRGTVLYRGVLEKGLTVLYINILICGTYNQQRVEPLATKADKN